MKNDVAVFITEGDKVRNKNGFVTDAEIKRTELFVNKLSNSLSDEITGGQGGWHIAVKLAVDVDDYHTAFLADSAGRQIRPQKLEYDSVTYMIKKPTENLKTHQMELLCTEVE